jgi:hypothetical protein
MSFVPLRRILALISLISSLVMTPTPFLGLLLIAGAGGERKKRGERALELSQAANLVTASLGFPISTIRLLPERREVTFSQPAFFILSSVLPRGVETSWRHTYASTPKG